MLQIFMASAGPSPEAPHAEELRTEHSISSRTADGHAVLLDNIISY